MKVYLTVLCFLLLSLPPAVFSGEVLTSTKEPVKTSSNSKINEKILRQIQGKWVGDLTDIPLSEFHIQEIEITGTQCIVMCKGGRTFFTEIQEIYECYYYGWKWGIIIKSVKETGFLIYYSGWNSYDLDYFDSGNIRGYNIYSRLYPYDGDI